ncbi:class I adenylate-forming enzyme family protein [Nocardia sp. CA-151230]|uniref:class I adenylate-forming enzyme family protein n=1 Tax=Nocardia sp. CA-151230 TaxID=3239982 RepID=UPI003D94703D
MHFATLPDVRAAQSPEGLCLADDESGSITNAEFLARVTSCAGRLARAGVGAGDVVAIMLPNRLELVVVMFAAWRLGAAATPVNPWLTVEEAQYQLDDAGAGVLVCGDDTAAEIGAPVRLALAELNRGGGADATAVPVADDAALALLIYTSGSTGRPKGVELTHANIMGECVALQAVTGAAADDHSMLILPLFHVNGIVAGTLTPLLSGGRVTITGRFHPDTFFGLVERIRPTYFSAVPTIVNLLSALPADVTPDTSSLKFVACGAAPMTAAAIERFESRFGVPICEGYGLSEASCASTLNPLHGLRKPGTVGLPLPGHEIAILGADGEFVTGGSTGEVLIKGPMVMRGYLGRPEATSEAVVDGWLHTGDIGSLDEDGYLVLVDRVKDMIIRGGENIYPKELEGALLSHPRVQEAAVVGRPDDTYGEVPVAFVAYRDGQVVAAEELTAHLRNLLAKFKIPADFITVEWLPRNPIGKIDKPGLRRRLAEIAK